MRVHGRQAAWRQPQGINRARGQVRLGDLISLSGPNCFADAVADVLRENRCQASYIEVLGMALCRPNSSLVCWN